MKMTFGKFKGKELEDLFFGLAEIDKDSYYCKWLIDNNILKGSLLDEFNKLLVKHKLTLYDYKKLLDRKIVDYRVYKSNYRTSNSVDLRSPEDYFYGYATDYPEYY